MIGGPLRTRLILGLGKSRISVDTYSQPVEHNLASGRGGSNRTGGGLAALVASEVGRGGVKD